MTICIPTKGDAGLQDSVFDHFGSAPYFTLYDSESGEVRTLANHNAHHSHGTCHPMTQLAGYNVDCVVCGGMGRRAIQALNADGIKVYFARAATVNEVVEQIKAGILKELSPAQACQGHGHHGAGIHLHGAGRGTSHGQGGGHQGNRGGGSGGSR